MPKNDENIINLNEDELKKVLNGREVVDMGTITVEKEEDWKLVYKYLDALKAGDEMYRPEGLKIERKQTI